MPEIDKHYTVKEGVETYHRRAMVKTFIWWNIKTIKYYTKTERCLKNHLETEMHVNGKGMKNIDLHVTMCCIALLAVALIRLQHGIKENLSSAPYLT